MNNIYEKTVHKEYSTPHELYPITSARGGGGGEALKAFSPPNRVRGGAPEALALTVFSLTKRRI